MKIQQENFLFPTLVRNSKKSLMQIGRMVLARYMSRLCWIGIAIRDSHLAFLLTTVEGRAKLRRRKTLSRHFFLILARSNSKFDHLPINNVTRAARLTLDTVGPAHGETVGNSGHLSF